MAQPVRRSFVARGIPVTILPDPRRPPPPWPSVFISRIDKMRPARHIRLIADPRRKLLKLDALSPDPKHRCSPG
jgi:hypothetical protein